MMLGTTHGTTMSEVKFPCSHGRAHGAGAQPGGAFARGRRGHFVFTRRKVKRVGALQNIRQAGVLGAEAMAMNSDAAREYGTVR